MELLTVILVLLFVATVATLFIYVRLELSKLSEHIQQLQKKKEDELNKDVDLTKFHPLKMRIPISANQLKLSINTSDVASIKNPPFITTFRDTTYAVYPMYFTDILNYIALPISSEPTSDFCDHFVVFADPRICGVTCDNVFIGRIRDFAKQAEEENVKWTYVDGVWKAQQHTGSARSGDKPLSWYTLRRTSSIDHILSKISSFVYVNDEKAAKALTDFHHKVDYIVVDAPASEVDNLLSIVKGGHIKSPLVVITDKLDPSNVPQKR